MKVNTTHSQVENLNIKAAMVHVISDLIQSIGVIMSSLIIYFNPKLTIMDPICTFIFCGLILFSTIDITKQCLHILMEGSDKRLDIDEISEYLIRKVFKN